MRKLSLPLAALALCACASIPADTPPIPTVSEVSLQRYAGDWYVIASIPPGIEKGAYNSVEHYDVDEDGNVPTVFTYRDGGFDGKIKTLKSKAYIHNRVSNAEWGVQFIWPVRAEYLIAWLADDYSQVIVARNKRDYVWMMARTPEISAEDYSALRGRIAAMGYDVGKLNKVPQRWPDHGR